MAGSWAQRDLPKLHTGNCQITSKATNAYNCIAWAAGTDKRWWDPNQLYYWPKGVPREVSIDAILKVYEGLGFTLCDKGNLEPGIDKIAVFVIERGPFRIPTHAARQLENGKWTSKLGPAEDVTHDSIKDVEGPLYGEVAYFLSRPKKVETATPEAAPPSSTNI